MRDEDVALGLGPPPGGLDLALEDLELCSSENHGVSVLRARSPCVHPGSGNIDLS